MSMSSLIAVWYVESYIPLIRPVLASAKTKIIRQVHFGRQVRQEASGSVRNNGFRQVASEAEFKFLRLTQTDFPDAF